MSVPIKLKSTVEFNEKYCDIIAKCPFDESNELAIVNIVPDSIKVRLQTREVKEMMYLGEEELTKLLQPNVVLRRIRSSIWIEYNRIHDRVTYGYPGGKIVDYALGPMRFCHGVCHPEYFFEKVLPNNLCMAYIFTPPPEYDLVLREALQLGVERLREMLEFPIYEEVMVGNKCVTKPNTKAADIVLKAYAIVDLRLNGSIPKVINQNISQETKNLNYNVNKNEKVINAERATGQLVTLADIDKRIAEVRDETNKLINKPSLKYKDKDFVYEDAAKVTDTVLTKAEERMQQHE